MENQRVRLSKTMLKNALISLLDEKNIDKITIYELCKKAQINRTTFYKYYGNQYDLLDEIEDDFFNQLEKYLSLYDNSELNALHRLMDFLYSERENCKVLINSVSDQAFCEKLFGLPAVYNLLLRYTASKYSEEQRQYVHLFFCQGGYAIIRRWLNSDGSQSPAQIAELIYSLGELLSKN